MGFLLNSQGKKEEAVKSKERALELEKKYQMVAVSGKETDDSFVSRIMKTVVGLFESELYRYSVYIYLLIMFGTT